MCLYFGFELRFNQGTYPDRPIYCSLIANSRGGDRVVFENQSETLTKAIDGVASAMFNKDSGILPFDLLEILRGETKTK